MWAMMARWTPQAVAEVKTGKKSQCLYVRLLCAQHEHGGSLTGGWFSYLSRPPAILANEQFELRAGLGLNIQTLVMK